jgi:beta-lactamase regulating signal transducer with metallopeptidase domain
MTTLMLALKLTVVFAFAGLSTTALRRGRAAARHLVWGLALGAALALPFLEFISPRVELAVLPVTPMQTIATESTESSESGAVTPIAAAADLAVPASTEREPAVLHTATGAATLDVPWLLLGWGAGSLLFALLVVASIAATARLARRTTEIRSGEMYAELADCRAALGLRRPVRLLLSRDQVMPMTWGARRPSVLLPAAAAGWTAERRRDVLLHELAHVRRFDWLSQLGARLVCAAYWWHPLSWYAAKQMREERELACDDLVIVHGTNPADYAHHLLAIAKDLRAAPATALAAVAMARPSQLAGRLLAALDATRRRSGVSRAHAGAAVTATATLMLPLAGITPVSAKVSVPVSPPAVEAPALVPPAVQSPVASPVAPRVASRIASPIASPTAAAVAPTAAATLCRWDGDEIQSGSHSSIDDDRVTIRISLDDCELSLRSRGTVRFSDDERDVAELGVDAWFELEERGVRGARRRAEFERRDGAIVRRFYVDGRETAWDAAAQAWFQSALVVAFRRTSFQARERVVRIYARGGGPAVLAEVDHIHSGSALATYLSFLGTRERLSSAQARRIAELAGERIASSSSLGSVLKSLLGNPGLDDDAKAAVVAATTRISSASERASVLVAAVEYAPLTPRLADSIARSAAGISSASERSRVLIAVGTRLPANAALPASYVEAARGISSSSALSAVLVALLQRDQLSDANLVGVLDVADRISSSSERSRVLVSVLEKHRLSDRTRASFFAVCEGISAQSEKGAVLRALIATKPDAATTALVLTTVGSMSSSAEQAQVLLSAAQATLITTPALRSAYERAAASISSRSERERVLGALEAVRTI